MAVVAQRLRDKVPRARRTPDEHAIVRTPKVYATLARQTSKLDPASPVRRRLLAREVASGWHASTRRDFELMAVRYSPDIVYEFNPELVTLGLPARVEGRETWIETLEEFASVWQEWRFTPVFLLDFGNPIVTLGNAWYRGDASQIELEIQFSQLVHHENGIAVHERDFTDWDEALAAAGLGAAVREKLEALAPGKSTELA
jgi:hypothetical protein